MDVVQTHLEDVKIIKPQIHLDERGFFIEAFHKEKYIEAGVDYAFVQDNHSGSKKGTLRGLHYQVRSPQGKLVWAAKGEIFDVVVDLRKKSPTYSQSFSVNLKEENKYQIWIPPGFAHGFYVLSEWAEVQYKVTDYYAPRWERTLLWNDPELKIDWPIIKGIDLIISEKDASGSPLSKAEIFED